MFSRVLEYKVFSGSKEEFLDYIDKYNKINIISGNPQILYSGLKNKALFNSYTSEDAVIIPDGIGTVMGCKIYGNPVKEKIAGIEVMESIIKKCSEEGKGIYLLGAKQEILNDCMINLKTKYSDLNILGSHNGYFDLDNCEEIVSEIEDKNPYAIFIAMGCPRQETFIANYSHRFNCKIMMGVGGSFDVIADKVKRAPQWMINLGLEWLYRTAKEPFRIKRLIDIPKFLTIVSLAKLKR